MDSRAELTAATAAAAAAAMHCNGKGTLHRIFAM